MKTPYSFLAGILAFALGACGGGNGTPGASSAAPAASAAQPASAAAAGSAAAKPSGASGQAQASGPADKIIASYGELVPQSMPVWFTQEAGIFQKNRLDVDLRLIVSTAEIAAL